jgi:ubiquinone/menaquinone biosynthesis C-methylase UbiE
LINKARLDTNNEEKLLSNFNENYELINEIYLSLNRLKEKKEEGYWSNISSEDQESFLSMCDEVGTLKAIKVNFPELEEMIYEPARSVGLKLLDIKSDHIGIDYGCMWGNMLIQSAKKCKHMVGVDQTLDSLKFLQKRVFEEQLDNVSLVHQNLRNEIELSNCFDFAIINGVLEWIPDTNQIELSKFFKKSKDKIEKSAKSPTDLQLDFLKKVHQNLNKNGKLYLAIENRWDYQHFLWKRDPHSNLFFTAILPRGLANLISRIYYGRPYVNYIYSYKELETLLKAAGFSTVDKYAAFPDYHIPQMILDLKNKDTSNFRSLYKSGPTKNIVKKIFRKIRYTLDFIIYKKMKSFNFSPAIIIIAKK